MTRAQISDEERANIAELRAIRARMKLFDEFPRAIRDVIVNSPCGVSVEPVAVILARYRELYDEVTAVRYCIQDIEYDVRNTLDDRRRLFESANLNQ